MPSAVLPRASRVLSLLLGALLLISVSLHAADAAPFSLGKQFSVEMLVAARGFGHKADFKLYVDDGNVRSDVTTNDKETITLVLPAQAKTYQIIPAQKLALVRPYLIPAHRPAAQEALRRPFQYVGPDSFDGIACYKFRSPIINGTSFFIWVDAVRKIPLRMREQNGVFTIILKDYQPGPQNPALFAVPAGYQVMTMPTLSAVMVPAPSRA